MSVCVNELNPFGKVISPSKSPCLSDLDVGYLRSLLVESQLLVLRGFSAPTSKEELVNFGRLWGDISLWPFGEVLELKQEANPHDHIFDNSSIPLHWDGMYRRQVPELQIFQCVTASCEKSGGRTTFANTLLTWNQAQPQHRHQWAQVTGIYRRKMAYYDSKTTAPIVCKHPTLGQTVLRFNEPTDTSDDTFINHPSCSFVGISEEETPAFTLSLKKALLDPRCF